MEIEVREVDPTSDVDVHAVVACRAETAPEIDPDDPPAGFDELRADLSRATTQKHVRTWLATVGGDPAGEICFELDDDDDNAHVASTDWFSVVPALRRRGVADALLRASLPVMAGEGRTSLLLWAPQLAPDSGRAYAERLGLAERTEERCSRVRVDEIDDGLIEGWLSDGRARAGGYRIVQFGDRCPDEHLDAYVEATAAMEDMPVDDLEWTPPEVDGVLLRSREAVWRAARLTVARSMAIAPDGSGAGTSELFVSGFRPSLAWQGDTGVVAGHRGHGLGRWLKAENLRLAQRLSPGFEVIETYNAQSNPWMLDINVAMGFRPHVIWHGYQGDLGRALDTVRI